MSWVAYGSWTCKDCGNVYEKLQSYCAHRRAHGKNVKGKVPWNKGLTRKTDPRVGHSDKTRAKLSALMKGRVTSEKTKQKLSEIAFNKIKNGTWHNSFSRSRQHIYANEKFDGLWEVQLAQWFDIHKIMWIRNKESFPYNFDKPRTYTPDFYLPLIDCYVEVKGWKTSKDDAKWKQFPKFLIVFSGSDLVKLGLPISVRKDWKTMSRS